ncbi:hypothetical protein IFM89_014990 [Coptis chinensis]|uniref:non-specific serine/threonine protein kinase n=1 Tax=Coptis chinensis TaxID=261450 RepID=A0A835HKH9_9MAGN|nr:hypothetical protein IFM89_014990 [Coptis chinensis]
MSTIFAWLFLLATSFAIALENPSFVYNGFKNSRFYRDGVAEITGNGLLRLTNYTKLQKGHAFYPKPFQFKNQSSNNSIFSFSSTFVFAMVPKYPETGGHGIAFVIAPSRSLPGAVAGQYLGLFNVTSNGDPSNHIVAVELDTVYSSEFGDINANHVGIDLNNLTSAISDPAKYYLDHTGRNYKNLSLMSGQEMQVWIEYDGLEKQLNVTIAPIKLPKPQIPLLSLSYDLSSIILDSMYVGFSSSTGSVVITSHYILGWSFQMNGQARALDLSRLPKLPRRGPKEQSKALTIGLPIIIPVFVVTIISITFFVIRWKRKYAEVFEDWELGSGSHRFSYKDLYIATKGFRDKELLGIGGFGRVYKGVLPSSKIEVAVKRVSHESKQGIKEFIAEIVSIGQLRHRNLVQLLGYCRRKGELLLVYDFMPHGSLDKFLFCPSSSRLNWSQRFRIIKGVASGLVYLHEEWEQVVIHRDVKASNVLIDGEWNGRLGDFGLARLYDHGTNPETTHVVGTLGYLAPEMTRTGKGTTSTDVFAFGAFLLEVACGRKPIQQLASDGKIILVDWVVSCWSRGAILETTDPSLVSDYVTEEMELVLKLGLLCSHKIPAARPSMRQVVQFLDKDVPLLELSSLGFNAGCITCGQEGFDEFVSSSLHSSDLNYLRSSSVAGSVLSSGR